MLLGAVGASLLGDNLAGKRINRARKGWKRGINGGGEGVLRVVYGNNKMSF